jgi:precorrin-6B C5,15-methyltransferase / cobalt-precorrin-6B C5,C15-methyltransferase
VALSQTPGAMPPGAVPPATFPPATSPQPRQSPAPILVVGLPSNDSLPEADLYVGALRHLEMVPAGKAVLPVGSSGASLAVALDRTAEMISSGRRVCVLVQGDPGFFGVGRVFAERFGPGSLEVRPAPSAVSLAFARLGLPWDDAIVVSAQSRDSFDAFMVAYRASASGHKVAVITSSDAPPERVGQAMVDAAAGDAATGAARSGRGQTTPSTGEQLVVAVCSRVGTTQERVTLTDLGGLAVGTWDPPSVVLLLPREAIDSPRATGSEWSGASRSWLGGAIFGREAGAFLHRDGMASQPEVRATVLSKLDLPLVGVLWSVGASAASVAIEAALLAPGLEVHALEGDPRGATQARANATRQSAAVKVHNLHAPEGLAGLPRPDRIFVRDAGAEVVEACLGYLHAGGRMVAATTFLDGALVAAELLGALVQVNVAAGERAPDGDWNLAGSYPTFIAWGPRARST